MADYRIDPSSYPQISPNLLLNQNNPFDQISRGIESGASLGFQARQQRRLEEQLKKENERQEREQKQRDLASFGTAIKNLKGMPPKLKETYWNNFVYPLGQSLGLQVEQGYDPSVDEPIVNDVAQIFEHHKKDPKSFTTDDVLGSLYVLSHEYSKAGEPDLAKNMMDVAKEVREQNKPSSAESGQFAGFQGGQGVIFNPKSKTFETAPLPGQGPFLPKGEPAKLEEQMIQNKEAVQTVNSIADYIKDTSGVVGGLKSLGSKLTAGAIGPEIRIYQSQKPAIAVKLYRAFTGDTRLSDADAMARAYPLLPDTYESKEVQDKKIKDLRDAAEGRNERILGILTGTISASPNQVNQPEVSQPSWSQDKERRYQELLKKQQKRK